MKKMFYVLFLLLFFPFISYTGETQKADLIIFSYNRPLQLYALLESIQTYMTGLNSITLIYRAGNDRYFKAYQEVLKSFPLVRSLYQLHPPQDFKPLVLNAFGNTKARYVLFAVDDNIVKDYCDISECIAQLENQKAYGFYLMLGTNLNWCSMLNKTQPVPSHTEMGNDMIAWVFKDGVCDWRYPHSVDMVLYRKSSIARDIQLMVYDTPTELEGQWATRVNALMSKTGLCYKQSKVVNLPLNRVQTRFSNNWDMKCKVEDLLLQFEQGLKFDIAELYQINNNDMHFAFMPKLIKRK